jgi:hypothetical protein
MLEENFGSLGITENVGSESYPRITDLTGYGNDSQKTQKSLLSTIAGNIL